MLSDDLDYEPSGDCNQSACDYEYVQSAQVEMGFDSFPESLRICYYVSNVAKGIPCY